MQSGELTLSNHGHIDLPLKHFPSKVEVYFLDNGHIPVPCNPHQPDELEYEVHSSNLVLGRFVLKIKWRVATVREVVYKVYY